MAPIYRNLVAVGFMLVVLLIWIGLYQANHNQAILDDAIQFADQVGSEDANRDYDNKKWRFLTVSRSEWFTYVVGVDSDIMSSCLIEQYGGDRIGQDWLLDRSDETDRDYAARIDALRNSTTRTLIYADAYNRSLLERLKSDGVTTCL